MVEKSRGRSLDKMKGRGSFLTFLIKTTITKLINIIRESIQSAIPSEVKETKMYIVQIDSTQDIASVDQ